MMLRSVLCAATLAALAVADADVARGYPLFFGSFEDVGETRIEPSVVPVASADAAVTDWLKGCPADAFVVVRDSSPFELTAYKPIQRLAEQSITRGSFLTDYMLDVRELSLDLEDYCEATLVKVDVDAPESIEGYIDTKPRVFYVEFGRDVEAEQKDLVLSRVLGGIPSPFVTVLYASTFQQAQPIFRSVELSPLRTSWSRQRQRHKADKITPIIAPLFKNEETGHAAPEPAIHLPDHFFFTLLIASVSLALFLAYNDWKKGSKPSAAKKNKATPGSTSMSAPARVSGPTTVPGPARAATPSTASASLATATVRAPL